MTDLQFRKRGFRSDAHLLSDWAAAVQRTGNNSFETRSFETVPRSVSPTTNPGVGGSFGSKTEETMLQRLRSNFSSSSSSSSSQQRVTAPEEGPRRSLSFRRQREVKRTREDQRRKEKDEVPDEPKELSSGKKKKKKPSPPTPPRFGEYTMPALEQWLTEKGSPEYATKAVALCARISKTELEGYGPEDLVKLVTDLGVDDDAVQRYEKLFKENALDGWVFLEITDWVDYAEIGMEKKHAVALCAVAKGMLGEFGVPQRKKKGGGVKLSASEEAALKAADHLADKKGIGAVYGQLVVLGYKEYRVEGSTWHPVGGRNEKFELKRRRKANGIRRSCAYIAGGTNSQPSQPEKHKEAPAVPNPPVVVAAAGQKRSTEASHSVTMCVQSGRTADGRVQGSTRVTVEYVPDAREDMFQLGRMIVPQNDFVVRGPLHLDSGGVLCGPVSRYACRLACSRLPPYECKLFAAGFNNEKDIFLSEMAPKWQLAPGEVAADDLDNLPPLAATTTSMDEDDDALPVPPEQDSSEEASSVTTSSKDPQPKVPETPPTPTAQWDALTTFGVRIWKPEIGEWREVSVHGGIHEPRKQPDVAGRRYPMENSTLTNGTIVDLAGIQLLFESAESMREHDQHDWESPSDLSAPDRIVARFNARRPQCPVQLHTIRLEYDDAKRKALAKDRTPYIFPACGHVHAFAQELRSVSFLSFFWDDDTTALRSSRA